MLGLVLGLAAGASTALAEPVDLELLLAVDSSSSVDNQEFALQMQGLANAFRHPAVVEAIKSATPAGIAVSLVQWSGAASRAQVIGWTVVADRLSAYALAAEIDATPRVVTGGPTAIGTAIGYATALIHSNQFQGARRIIDVSGDGVNNEGEYASSARARAVATGITVNGLAILNDDQNLARYYLAGVVGGPGAFVQTAADFRDFAVAIRQKLITEITGGTVSEAPTGGSAPGEAAGLTPSDLLGRLALKSGLGPAARRARPLRHSRH